MSCFQRRMQQRPDSGESSEETAAADGDDFSWLSLLPQVEVDPEDEAASDSCTVPGRAPQPMHVGGDTEEAAADLHPLDGVTCCPHCGNQAHKTGEIVQSPRRPVGFKARGEVRERSNFCFESSCKGILEFGSI